MYLSKAAAALLASGFIVTTPLYAQSDDFRKYTQEHLDNIYQRLNSANFQATAILDVRRELEELRSENRILRDQIEVLTRKTNMLEDNFKNAQANALTNPPINPENLQNGEVGGTSPLLNSNIANTEQQSLAQAKVMLRNKVTDQAIGLLEPLTASANREVALESQYWLGVSYVTQQDCTRARPYLQSFFNAAPQHEFAPEAMLANAICERQAGNNKAYEDSAAKIKSLYPNSRAAKALP